MTLEEEKRRQKQMFSFANEEEVIKRIQDVMQYQKSAGWLNAFDEQELYFILKDERYTRIFLQRFHPQNPSQYFYKKVDKDSPKKIIIQAMIKKIYF